jgi:hypothetical protein
MANSIFSTQVQREKFAKAKLEVALRTNLVAEKICKVDRSDAKLIKSPYLSAMSATFQAAAGTYTLGDITVNNDTLTVAYEVIGAGHLFDFESAMNEFDTMSSVFEEMAAQIAIKIDQYVVNKLTEDGTGTYTTPAGGFTTAANINQIFGDLVSKVSGYSDAYWGNMFVVVENTDLPGLMVAGATNGFNNSDKVLTNGQVGQWMGVDIYVVRTGTFTNTDIGDFTAQNSGHRVFGVKGVSTYASPRGITYNEKDVTLKTGKELLVYGYVGFKLWTPKAALIVDITLA